jgi:hypothetical protein
VAPTTTTTAAPTTTTTAPAASPTVSITDIDTDRYTVSSRGYWRLEEVDISLVNSSGQGVGGATVTIRITPNTGDAVEITCVTSSSSPKGTCTASQGQDREFRTGGSDEVDYVDVRIVSVVGGTPAWTGPAPASQRVNQP